MPEETRTISSGLLVKGKAGVPFTGVSIAADIRSLCARVTVTQRYVNTERDPIEAVYVFPLDEGAAVCGFEAIIDGTLVVGEVREREEAFRIYDDAMAEGHGAYLLDEERPDVFQASVGNLPPGKEALLRITYVTELAVDGNALRFVIPTTVSPRYAPEPDRIGVGRPDADTLNPPVEWRVPYGLDLSIRLAVPSPKARVGSPSHPIAVAHDDHFVTVKLSQESVALDRDFVLTVEDAGLDRPSAWIERTDDGRYAIAVGFVPEFPAQTSPADIVFVVDRSGSMQGDSIEQVRAALQVCLRSLIAGCRFNIVGFGSRVESLFARSRPYDDETLAQATAHVDSLEADLGGTEILPALTAAFAGDAPAGVPRQVVVLTDGQVTNTDAVLALVRSHAARTRVFAFGIGAGASRHLVRGIARAGDGAAEFIGAGARIESKVVRLIGRLLSPAITDVRLDWGGLEIVPAPRSIPPVFSGSRLVVYGFANDLRASTLRLTATAAIGPLAFEVPIDPSAADRGAIVATLAARARIRELEESPEWLEGRASRQQRARGPRVSQEIVDLAMRYGLVSRETSYVAVERRETPVTGEVQLRRVPIALTYGWGGVDRRPVRHSAPVAGAMPASAALRVAFSSGSAPAPESPPSKSVASRLGAMFSRDVGAAPRADAGSPRAPRESDPPRAGMLAVVVLQRADGSWELTRQFAQALGTDLVTLERGLATIVPHADSVARRAWATALAIAWLRIRVPALEDEWRMLVQKAERWLQSTCAPEEAMWLVRAHTSLSP